MLGTITWIAPFLQPEQYAKEVQSSPHSSWCTDGPLNENTEFLFLPKDHMKNDFGDMSHEISRAFRLYAEKLLGLLAKLKKGSVRNRTDPLSPNHSKLVTLYWCTVILLNHPGPRN